MISLGQSGVHMEDGDLSAGNPFYESSIAHPLQLNMPGVMTYCVLQRLGVVFWECLV